MKRIRAENVLGFRVGRHCLERRAPSGSLVEVVRRLCGVHAQLATSAELALWARVDGLRRDEVRAALEDERSLVKTWAMRGTLHLLAADDLALYVAVLGPRWDDPGAGWLRGFGVTKEQYEAILAGVPKVLGTRPRTREELADGLSQLVGPDVRERVVSGWGSLLKPSARRGDLAFGPNRGRNVTFVRPDRWLGKRAKVDPMEAQREIVRRFLAAYGPATADDFGRWLGMRAGLKRMLAGVENELVDVELGGQHARLLAADARELAEASAPTSVRLLPAFDPYVVGFRPRGLLVSAANEPRIFRPQGWFSPVVLEGGRAAGIWRHERRGRKLDVSIEPFRRLSATTRRAVAEEVDRLAEYFDARPELSLAA